MRTGVLLIGHGTRRQHGMEEFLTFVSAVRREFLEEMDARPVATEAVRSKAGVERSRPSLTFEHAFLELAEPDIASGLFALTRQGVESIVCVPLLLFSAGHIKHDIPQAMGTFHSENPEIRVQMLSSFGDGQEFVDVAASRLLEALSSDFSVPIDAVLFLGRGNRDEEAQAVVASVAHRLDACLKDSGCLGVNAPLRVGYLAGSGSSLETTLDALAGEGARHIVVLPYLWFSGYLTDTLPRRLETWREGKQDAPSILIASHLGPHPCLVEAVVNRMKQAIWVN